MSNVIPINKNLPEEFPQQEPGKIIEATKNLSLFQLVANRREIETLIENNGGELTGDIEDLWDQANDLIAGKIDRVAAFVKDVIPAHIAACQEQIKRLKWLEEKVKDMTIEAIKASGPDASRLEGLAYRARIQANPPSIVIDNPDVVPTLFKKGVAEVKIKFDPSDTEASRAVRELLADLKNDFGADTYIEVLPDNESLRAAVLDKKDKKGEVVEKGTPVEGVHVEQGVHVRFEAGKAKASKVAGKKAGIKEIEQ